MESIILKIFGAFILGLLLGVKFKDVIAPSKDESKQIRETIKQPTTITKISDQEVWNVVTNYGKYPDVWEIYRGNGWLEAIKSRDDKVEFDNKVSRIRNKNKPNTSITTKQSTSQPIQQPSIPKFIDKKQTKLDELDLACVKSLVSYFETMPGKISRYYQDHQASQEEAEVIAKYYQKTVSIVNSIETKQDLKNLIKYIENLKNKVSPYKHKEFKYRWSTSLQKKVLDKLEKIKH
ncbi:MAG: hypothetical protein AB4060_15145 [Crocosphaera sp.]